MSKMSEIDLIAQGVADHCKEIMYDTVEWQIADQPVNGDDYNAIHSQVMFLAAEKLYTEIYSNYKQNTIISG